VVYILDFVMNKKTHLGSQNKSMGKRFA